MYILLYALEQNGMCAINYNLYICMLLGHHILINKDTIVIGQWHINRT